MRGYVFPITVSAVLAAGGAAAIAMWLTGAPSQALALRVPGSDRSPQATQAAMGPVTIEGKLTQGDGAPSDLAGSWPQFRGANLDNISTETVRLARTWPAGGPPVLWKIVVGEGYAAAAVRRGRVYLIDYDKQQQADAVRCLSLADGKEIWRYSYPVKVKRNHGMSRTVPAVTDKYVVTIGPKCHLSCLDATTGEPKWPTVDLTRAYGAKVPPWYAGQCPLIENGRIIIAPAGEALMVAIDCATGEVVWKTPNPHGWRMTHSSIVPMQFYEQRMYVYCASGGVVGVAAQDGRLLWETRDWKISIANVPSPVPVGDDRIFLTGGYNAGSMMLELTEKGDQIVPRPAFRLEPNVFSSPQHTPILYQGHLYAVRPDGQLACASLDGELVWASGSANVFGLGPFLIADGMLFVMNNEGRLTIARASPTGYKPLAQADVLRGHDAWGPMALASGRLIARDLTRMVCIDVKAP